ncbi:MAG: hypothetical protein FJ288_07600 [Planctomycetes bacterium]|nr:hypothetical protein [Planctomycetota bacterium]
MGNPTDGGLATPVFLKLAADMGWPKDKPVFYLLTADGLYICRNHPFFQSSVLARGWPSELARHRESLRLTYPKVPRRLLELCVGFFDRMAEAYSAEAAAVLLWDGQRRRVSVMIPRQVSKCRRTYGGTLYGLSVRYEMPVLPGHLAVIGDIHSHVDGGAYASYADRCDEAYRPGLHVVCGRIDREPPDFYADAIVDGVRFSVATDLVLEGYRRRRPGVPAAWMRRVKVDIDDPYRRPAQTTAPRRREDDDAGRGAPASSSSYYDRYYGDTHLDDPKRHNESGGAASGQAAPPRRGTAGLSGRDAAPDNGDGAPDQPPGDPKSLGQPPPRGPGPPQEKEHADDAPQR